MKKIAFFCIPAHGHTNPMLPVAAELVKRGNAVRFYSFPEFREKILQTGAEFVSCYDYLPHLSEQELRGIKAVSATEMTVQAIRSTLSISNFLDAEFESFCPDIIYTDSVCFWGKLTAQKYNVPMVVSTSTFAFNQLSAQYMKYSPKELWGMISGIPKVSRELKKLEPYGFHIKNALSLVQNDNDTDSVVYTSKRFQPYSESFSEHYAFVGPSVFSKAVPEKAKARPLVYISLGTVINDNPDFYTKCIAAVKNHDIDVIISCGNSVHPEDFAELPDNVKMYPFVNQLEILAKADAFITHCGMNSVSESLYMATPMVLYPRTGEQEAVAKRAGEIGAGIMLKKASVCGISAALSKILSDPSYKKAAKECSDDFRNCVGAGGAAEFVETAPHSGGKKDILKEIDKQNRRFQTAYRIISLSVILLSGFFISWKYVWAIGLATGVIAYPLQKAFLGMVYRKLVKKISA